MTHCQPPSRLFRSESMTQALSIYLPATILSRGLGLARGLLLAWFMPQAQFGLLQIALLVTNLLSPLCSAGLNEGVQRYVPLHETRGTLRRFLRLAVPLVLATGTALAGVVFILAPWLGAALFTTLRTEGAAAEGNATTILTRVAAVAAFGLAAFFLVISILKGLRMYRAIGLIELANNAVFTVLALAVAWAGWNHASPLIGCYAFGVLSLAAISAIPLRRAVGRIEPLPAGPAPAGKADTDAFRPRPVVGQMLRFSVWAALASITWQILLGYPLWYLNKAAGSEVAAIYVGVQLIAQGMVIISHAVVTVVETAVTKTWESRTPAEADRDLALAYKLTTLALLAGGAVVVMAAPTVLRILPAQYAVGAGILPLLVLFFLLAGHLLFLGIHFHLIERTRHLFLPWLLGVLGHVLFSAWLVRPDLAPADARLAAGWAGIAGMGVALTGALALMIVERRPLDRGSWLLIAAGVGLIGPAGWAPAVMLGAVLILCVFGPLIFTPAEKQRLRAKAADGRTKLNALLHRSPP